jgi:hypothetical protein
MKTIIALLRKDLAVMRKYSLYLAVMAVNVLAMPFVLSFAPISGLVNSMFFIVFAAMPLQLEERGKGLSLIASLPVKRSAVPAAQYVFLASLFLFVLAVYGGIALVARSIPGYAELSRGNFVTGIVVLSFPFVTLSALFPLWYRFGYLKMRLLTTALLVGFAVITSLYGGFGSTPGIVGRADPSAFLRLFEGLPTLPVLIACPLAVMAALGISCLVSMRIYEKKEF